MYSVRGRNAAVASPAATEWVWNLWNPHSSQRIRIIYMQAVVQASPTATQSFGLSRSSTRGTPGSTVTPAIQNHSRRGVAPPAAPLLDLSQFTGTQPVIDGDGPSRLVPGNAVGTVCIWSHMNVEVPPGTGFGAVVITAAVAMPACEIVIVWEEDF